MFMENNGVPEGIFLFAGAPRARQIRQAAIFKLRSFTRTVEGWPSYWKGFPPLMHPTHALAPCLMLTGRYPAQVYGRGSGRIREELQQQYYCPFAFESAFVSLENSDLTIEMERFLYGVARSYSECFRVYGEKSSFVVATVRVGNARPLFPYRRFREKQHL
mgnify:CR=1 FL=1